MDNVSFFTFAGLIVFAVVFSTAKAVKNGSKNTVSGFFLANRSNGFLLVGASLYFSNISANQFIGENESVFINNMSVIGWGVTSVFAMLIVSEYFVPIYLKTGISTIPDFLEKRYDAGTKNLVSIVFLFSYILSLLPTVLYGGAVAFNSLFHISERLQIGHWEGLWLTVWFIGLIGLIYSVLGGLRAINISDIILTSGLFVLMIVLPYYGLKYLGEGSFMSGVHILLNEKTAHLNAIGGPDDAIPFSTLFTGMIIVNLYYWGMEQYIVQQILAGKSLQDSQKGIALTCGAKLLSPLLINIPGLIAVHLYTDLANSSAVFPTLAKDVLPAVMAGLTAAVLFGAALNTFNAGLNGASSLFVFNIFRPYRLKRKGSVDEKEILRAGKLFQICVALLAMCIAPFILFSEKGFYFYIQKVSGIFSVPIFTIIFIGFFKTKIPALAAKIAVIFFITCYVLSQFILDLDIHFLHALAIIFLVTTLLMFLIGRIKPMEQSYVLIMDNKVDIKPWANRWYWYLILIVLMVGVYIVFSPLGVA